MEAECNSPGAWQARFAYLNHSGSISRCKDWAVVIHIRNIDVDSGSWGHRRHAAVYCLDEQGVSRHPTKAQRVHSKDHGACFLLGPHRGAVGLLCFLLKMSCLRFESLDQVFNLGTSNVWSQIILCYQGMICVYCRMFSRTPAVYLLEVNIASDHLSETKMSPNIARCPWSARPCLEARLLAFV